MPTITTKCKHCHEDFSTNQPNANFCRKEDCQRARKREAKLARRKATSPEPTPQPVAKPQKKTSEEGGPKPDKGEMGSLRESAMKGREENQRLRTSLSEAKEKITKLELENKKLQERLEKIGAPDTSLPETATDKDKEIVSLRQRLWEMQRDYIRLKAVYNLARDKGEV